ncbi:MAG: hypothetical protein GY765_17975 [bacterium]|nr:hypothetical protein [bacterium]
MRKINYNIAENKKIDYIKFSLVSSAVVLMALLFMFLGIRNIWSSDQRIQDEKEKLRLDKLKVEELTDKVAGYKQGIKRLESKWNKRVNYINSLIDAKQFDLVKRLDIIEKHLPEGVYIQSVNMAYQKKGVITIDIAAQSLQRVMETYANFSAYKPQKSKEAEVDGLFQSRLILKL